MPAIPTNPKTTSPAAPTHRGQPSLAEWLDSTLAGVSAPPALVFVGLGDGEVLRLVAARFPAANVLALEPDPATAARCAAHPLAVEWRASGRLTYLVGPAYSGSDRAWRVFPDRFEAPPVLVHPQLVMTPAVAKATEVLKAILFGAEANARARKKFAPQYLLNSLRNLPGILAGRDVRDLAGAFAGVPAVLVAAGPSLDRNLPELAALKDRALIIATDTAARPLLAAGVTPQLIVGLDPGAVNGRHLLALPGAEQSWLVAESALDPRATAAFGERTFWFRVGPHQPWPWLNGLGLDIGRLDVWGSVLTGAFNLAVLAGCGPIVLVGADLSFPGRRPYARGTTYEFDWAWASALGTTLDQTWDALMQRELIEQPDVHGRPVPTTPAMRSFRDWLLAQARGGERRIVNATGDGILVGPGIEQTSLQAVLDGPVTLADIAGLGTPRPRVSSTALAAQLRGLDTGLTAGTDGPTIVSWNDFTLGTLDRAQLGAAMSDAMHGLEHPTAASSAALILQPARESAVVRGALTRMPESHLRLRRALGVPGAPGAHAADTPAPADGPVDDAGRLELMTRALYQLRTLIEAPDAASAPVTIPNPSLLGTASVGALATWSEPERWTVLQIEALLGAASRSVDARRADKDARRRVEALDPRLLLACEWVRVAADVGLAALGGSPLTQRAVALARDFGEGRRGRPPAADAMPVVLRLEARAGAGHATRQASLDVTLPLSSDTLATLLTGLLVPLAVVAALPASTPLPAHVPAATIAVGGAGAGELREVCLNPRRLTTPTVREFVIGGPTERGVLVAATRTHESFVVRDDGALEPHATWPRPITGVLPLREGRDGVVAWSSISVPATGTAPYVMHRVDDVTPVQVVDVAFRPAGGLEVDGTVHWTCLPDADGGAGLASWTPGGEPVVDLRDRTFIGIVARDGRPLPQERSATGAVAHEATTADGQWTAAAVTNAHRIDLVGPDGSRHAMICDRPYRVAWCGGSLLVTTLDRHLLLFEGLVTALEDLA